MCILRYYTQYTLIILFYHQNHNIKLKYLLSFITILIYVTCIILNNNLAKSSIQMKNFIVVLVSGNTMDSRILKNRFPVLSS